MPSKFPRPELHGERSTGIIRTLPYFGAATTEEQGARQDAYKRMIQSFKDLESGKRDCVYIAFNQMPKQEVLHCYIIVAGRVRVRANIAGWEKGDGEKVTSWDGHDLSDSKYWCILSAPVSWPPEPILRRGFQGHRYCGNLW